MTKRVNGEDVYVQDTTEDVVIEQAEDVMVEGDAVGGSLTIKNAQDVIIKTDATVSVEQSEDVNVDGKANVTVKDAQDVVEDDGLL
jgi:hypothetical protein